MSNLTGADIISQARDFMGEPSQDRFTDGSLVSDANMALSQVMLDLQWPEATYYLTSDGAHFSSGTEVPLPDITSFLRLYVAGTPVVPSSRDLMEGVQSGEYQAYGAPGTPAWTQAVFTGYPVASDLSKPDPVSMAYFQGERPRYYFNGGALGIVPPPTAGYIVAFDCFPAAPVLADASSQSKTFYPQRFKEALAWRTCLYAYFSSGSQIAGAKIQLAKGMYDEQMVKLRKWKESFNRNLPEGPVVVPHRLISRGPLKVPTSRRRN